MYKKKDAKVILIKKNIRWGVRRRVVRCLDVERPWALALQTFMTREHCGGKPCKQRFTPRKNLN